MHFLLYVCVPTDEARTSLQARRRVCRYLNKEHFISKGRFCGYCDYFSVGGRFAGTLNLLRFKHHHPRKYKQLLVKYPSDRSGIPIEEANELIRSWFSEYKDIDIFYKNNRSLYGNEDDAQIIDEVLFEELKDGFDELVTYSHPFEKPNVIFIDLDEEEWRRDPKIVIGRQWVVVIDYHG